MLTDMFASLLIGGFQKGFCEVGGGGNLNRSCMHQMQKFILRFSCGSRKFSQGFDAKLIIATGARATPIIEISPPHKTQRAPNPPEFAQPRLSGAKRHGSNTPRFVASPLGNTSHLGTNAPKFVPSQKKTKRAKLGLQTLLI